MVSRELLEACRRGDAGAFEELVERTQRHVYTLAYRLVGDRHEAEDVAQEAYLRVFRSLRGFRQEARFETWLYRIVTNAAFTHLRRRGRFGVLLAEGQEQAVEEPEVRPVEAALDRDEVKRALQGLTPGPRAVVVLKDVYGLSCQEIADEMGLSESAVKVRLHRARKRLKEVIWTRAT
ncbi:MAG TPA: sigma-70 family RNA polymerase sigma factor [Actinomycetota bacterium]|nr:sigma-70 family RNA polymerase sigma factor [Actinomycetota bacterium]